MNNPPEDVYYLDMVGMGFGHMGAPYSSTALNGVDDPATDFGHLGSSRRVFQPPASTGQGGSDLVTITWNFS